MVKPTAAEQQKAREANERKRKAQEEEEAAEAAKKKCNPYLSFFKSCVSFWLHYLIFSLASNGQELRPYSRFEDGKFGEWWWGSWNARITGYSDQRPQFGYSVRHFPYDYQRDDEKLRIMMYFSQWSVNHGKDHGKIISTCLLERSNVLVRSYWQQRYDPHNRVFTSSHVWTSVQLRSGISYLSFVNLNSQIVLWKLMYY